MSAQLLSLKSVIAQTNTTTPSSPTAKTPEAKPIWGQLWMFSTIGVTLMLVALTVYGKLQIDKQKKAIKFEQFKNKGLSQKLKLALNTIKKMETNPDLVHSREFNLDYLRLRMDEEVFHYSIINQVKIRIKQIISVALRPSTATSTVGIANVSGRQISETFDVNYETESQGKRLKRVLFRIQIKLTKLPTQSTSSTIQQIIDCIETFLSPGDDHEHWQPTIQGRVVIMDWDQKAKPTPLLVLQQSGDGVNVSFRTNPVRRADSLETNPQARAKSKAKAVPKQKQLPKQKQFLKPKQSPKQSKLQKAVN